MCSLPRSVPPMSGQVFIAAHVRLGVGRWDCPCQALCLFAAHVRARVHCSPCQATSLLQPMSGSVFAVQVKGLWLHSMPGRVCTAQVRNSDV